MAEQAGSFKKNIFIISEDWAVVILGFVIITIFLCGIIFPAPAFSWSNPDELLHKVLTGENISKMLFQLAVVTVIGIAAAKLTGKEVRANAKVIPVIYLLSVLALIMTGSSMAKSLNLEAVIFALAIGLILGNFFKLPEWFRNALAAETFVKIGLVLLGTGIIFSDILKAGSLGMIQALAVVLAVWYFAFWICKRFKLDSELSMMLSSAVSICGVSAAIATAGAIKGDPKKLSYIISLVLVTAIPMMIVMPYLAKALQLSEEVTGAWLGGTIDTTGAVVAAGTMVGETALKYSTIVKFSQNVLLGLAAFAISVYWAYAQKAPAGHESTRPSLRLLWDRFPKFVLGFIAASLLFSFVLNPETIAPAKDGLKSLQTLWFVLAFTSIGLETRFSDLFNAENKKPLYAFLIAQLFNIVITLVIAWLLFA